MKNKIKAPIIIAGVIVVALVAGGSIWYINNRNQDTQNTNQITNNNGSTQTNEAASDAKTVASILSAGKTQKCTFSYKEGTTDISGTMYFSSGRKMSGDFKTITEGQTTNGNMIISDNTQYFWTPDTNKGVKINLTSAESSTDGSSSGSTSASQGLDLDKNYDFNCSSWTLDETKFVVPTNVEFMDLSNIQSQLNNLPQ